jgi:glycosyltransferase involved in cell wall biosynthesis
MRLALASNFAPDRRPLSEYGYHLASGLRATADPHELVVLSGKFSTDNAPDVWRVWDNGNTQIPVQIVRALRHHRADSLLLNTHFTTWGSNRANLAGLLTPVFAKRAGFRVATLLHHLPHTINAKRVGYRLSPIHRLGIELGCRAVATSDVVCFTLKRDLDVFVRRYKPTRTVHVPLGLQGKPRWCPPPDTGTVLAFGHWGRSKDPEPLLRAFLGRSKVWGQLIIAGSSSHTRTGFQERLASLYRSEHVTFPGYVPEPQVPRLFHSSDLVVLPYKENTGASAVLHQTCQYGRVPLMRRLPVFQDMVDQLGLRGYFYDDEQELATQLRGLLGDPHRLAVDGRHNFEVIGEYSMERVAQIYWELFNHGD